MKHISSVVQELIDGLKSGEIVLSRDTNQIHMYYAILGSASRDEGRSWAAREAAIHRRNRIPLAETWISES